MLSSYHPTKKQDSFSTVDSGYSSGRQSTTSSQSISLPIVNLQNNGSNHSQSSYIYSESPPKQPAPINLPMKSSSPAQVSLLQTDNQILIDRFKLDYGYYYIDKYFESTERMFKSDNCNLEYPIENNLPLVYIYHSHLTKTTEPNHRIFNSNWKIFIHEYDQLINKSSLLEINDESELSTNAIKILFPIAKLSHNGTLAPYITSLLQSAIDNPQNPQKMTKLKKLCKQFLLLDVTLGGFIIIRNFDKNNSKNCKDLENIKAQISWTIDSAQWSFQNPFKFSTSRNFNFKIEDANGTYINDLDELECYLKRVFSCESVKIISYNKVVPLFNLFSQEMKVKLKPIFNLHDINFNQFNKQLIDKVPETHQFLKITDWISDNNILNLPFLFNNCSLNYGLSFNSTRILIGKRPAFQFKSEPFIIQQISKVVRFVPLDSKRNSFLLEGNCSTDGKLESLFSKNPFITNPLLKNDSSVNDMHFYIEDKHVELKFNENDIFPTTELSYAINNALNDNNPYKALHNVFNEFGHVICIDMTIGGKLNRIHSYPYIENDRYTSKKPEKSVRWETNEKCIEILNELEKLHESFDLTYFFNDDGQIISINKNDIESWIENNSKNVTQWQIIKRKTFIPMHQIFDNNIQEQIEGLIKNLEIPNVLMIGVNHFNNSNIKFIRINLDQSLESDDYKVYGSIFQGNEDRSNFVIKFRSKDYYGFSEFIEVPNNYHQNAPFTVYWMLVGKPSLVSYYSKRTRNIRIKTGEAKIKESTITITNLKDPLSQYCSIMTYLDYPPTNNEPSFEISLVSWSEYKIILKLSDNSSSQNDNLFQLSDYVLNWRIIYSNQGLRINLDTNDVWISPAIKLVQNLYTKDVYDVSLEAKYN
ncbi:173_t:CDS:2 [Gigaspora rosea]|nr:173_t:CDS:2 [Gigaspora rosea]